MRNRRRAPSHRDPARGLNRWRTCRIRVNGTMVSARRMVQHLGAGVKEGLDATSRGAGAVRSTVSVRPSRHGAKAVGARRFRHQSRLRSRRTRSPRARSSCKSVHFPGRPERISHCTRASHLGWNRLGSWRASCALYRLGGREHAYRRKGRVAAPGMMAIGQPSQG